MRRVRSTLARLIARPTSSVDITRHGGAARRPRQPVEDGPQEAVRRNQTQARQVNATVCHDLCQS
jgi:hypothetical protein